jgi:flagellar hook-length control protein FliK
VPSLLPPQQDTATPVVAAKVPAAQDDDAGAATLTVPVADASGVRAAAGTPPKASGDTAVRHAHRDSGRHTHQAASHSEDANTLSVAALQAAAEIVVGAPAAATDTATPASTAVPKLTAPTAAAAAPGGTADAVPTDIVASAMLSSGATVKPATTATATKPQSDSTKTQIRQSAAATLADASKAVGHAFSDPRAGSAAPAHVAMNDQTPHAPAASGASAPVPPDSSVQQPAATPAPPAAPHLQAPPQPSAAMPAVAPTVATTPAASPAAPAAGSAVSAQLQIGHAQPDTGTLAFTIAAKSADGARHFDIRLDPAELGRVDVRLTVDDAGKAQATLSVEKPQTLELLQKDQPQLERALRDAGLDLSQNGLNFSLRGQQQQSANSGGNAPGRSRALAARVIAAVDSAASTVSLGQMSPGDTRLDIKV